MNKSIIFGLLAVLLVLSACASPTGDVVAPDITVEPVDDTPAVVGEYDDFAKYLTEQGVVMVGAEWCGHCQDQKSLFGTSFQYVTFVDAVYEAELAASYGVQGYPTWVLDDGEFLVGKQSLKTLMEYTGYNA